MSRFSRAGAAAIRAAKASAERRGAGLPDDRVALAVGPDRALVHDHHPVAGAHLVDQVGCPQNRHPVGGQRMDVIDDARPARHVKADRGFVEQEDGRLMEQGAGQFDPPAQPAAQLADAMVASRRQIETLQFGVDQRAGPRRRRCREDARRTGGSG